MFARSLKVKSGTEVSRACSAEVPEWSNGSALGEDVCGVIHMQASFGES